MKFRLNKILDYSKENPIIIIATTIWAFHFFTLIISPIILMGKFSILTRDYSGGIIDQFSFSSWADLFSTNVIWVWIRSLLMAACNTLLCILIGIPIALGMYSMNLKFRKFIYLLLLLPLGINALLIGYSWQFILGNEGLINTFFIKHGIVTEPIALLYTPFSTVVGLLGFYLTYFILTFFTSLQHIDRGIIVASQSCGASDFQTLWKIILPISRPGIIAGALLVFLPSLAEYVIPQLLGGGKVFLFGNFTKYTFYEGRNWPLGAAMLTFATFILTIFIIPFIKNIRGVFSINDD